MKFIRTETKIFNLSELLRVDCSREFLTLFFKTDETVFFHGEEEFISYIFRIINGFIAENDSLLDLRREYLEACYSIDEEYFTEGKN